MKLNKNALLFQMERFEGAFHTLKDAIREEDTEKMKALMRLSTARRALFDKKGEEK